MNVPVQFVYLYCKIMTNHDKPKYYFCFVLFKQKSAKFGVHYTLKFKFTNCNLVFRYFSYFLQLQQVRSHISLDLDTSNSAVFFLQIKHLKKLSTIKSNRRKKWRKYHYTERYHPFCVFFEKEKLPRAIFLWS